MTLDAFLCHSALSLDLELLLGVDCLASESLGSTFFCLCGQLFLRVPGIQNQVLMFVKQALCLLTHLLSPGEAVVANGGRWAMHVCACMRVDAVPGVSSLQEAGRGRQDTWAACHGLQSVLLTQE